MAYDMKQDYGEYMGEANDYAHARLAKKMIDQKRKGPAAAPAGEPDGDEDMAPEVAEVAEAAEGDAPPADTEADPEGGKIPVEVTPEELAMLEEMRAAKAGGAPEAPPEMS